MDRRASSSSNASLTAKGVQLFVVLSQRSEFWIRNKEDGEPLDIGRVSTRRVDLSEWQRLVRRSHMAGEPFVAEGKGVDEQVQLFEVSLLTLSLDT